MVLPFYGSGVTPGGITVVLHDQTFKHCALVLDSKIEGVEAGDKVVFDEGIIDYLTDERGDEIAVLHDAAILGILPS